MKENVVISVKSRHLVDGLDERECPEIEVIYPGKYYFKDGKHYIFYEERDEETMEVIKSRMTLADGILNIRKKGALDSDLSFCSEEKCNSLYGTPYGNMMACTTVHSMDIAQEEDLLKIDLEYALELNYEHVADNKVGIMIRSAAH